MRSLIGALFLLVAPALATAQPALSLQEALLRAKPAVALVVSEVGGEVTVRCGAGAETTVTPPPFRETGTGWFVASAGWLVTNGHVVSPAHHPPEWLAREQTQKAIKQTCGGMAGAGRAKLEPSISVLLANGVRMPAIVVKYSPPVAGEAMSGQDLALLKLEAADMPALPLADSAQARIGDRLHIIGFPGVVLSHELLNASAKMEASVTGGAISGFKQDRANQPVIQTDASAAWGNSGGPAVNDAGEVVGVLTFVTLSSDAQSNIVQGFNFVIPSAAVTKFLEGTPVPRGEPSRFNAAWHAGLRDHFAGNYRRARAELGVSAWGMQVFTLPPDWDGYPNHNHSSEAFDPNQEEVYIPLSGGATLVADGSEFDLRPGMMVRVGPDQLRQIFPGPEGIRFVAIGGSPGAFTPGAWTELGADPPNPPAE